MRRKHKLQKAPTRLCWFGKILESTTIVTNPRKSCILAQQKTEKISLKIQTAYSQPLQCQLEQIEQSSR